MEQWRVLGREVCSLLDEYLVVHDSLIRQSGFWGLFRRIDFAGLATRARRVLFALDRKRADIDALFSDTADSLDQSETEFAECLAQYTESLRNAVELLVELLADLVAKTQGGDLTMSQHRENWKRYQEAIESYSAIGTTLNSLYWERTPTRHAGNSPSR